MKQDRNWPTFEVERRVTADLKPMETNARHHSKAQIQQIADSISRFGWTNPLLIDGDLNIIAGHGRHQAALLLSIPDLPCIVVDGWTEAERRAYAIADNRIAENAEWDIELLKVELDFIGGSGFETVDIGFTADDFSALVADLEGGSTRKASGALQEKFGFPPFSVLNARDGRWGERKRRWLDLGFASEEGRDDSLLLSSSSDFMSAIIKESGGGTSIFDPVLCELMYNWFCPSGGSILDPFAGGSVRGITASFLSRPYVGIDLRDEQVEANRKQAAEIIDEGLIAPQWFTGDSRNQADLLPDGAEFDFVFSCPPYADLEVYSEDERDLSNMDYDEFIEAYNEIILKACSRLKQDRFAAFVVGDVRDKKGIYRNFVSHTITAFQEAGLSYYNEAILVTQAASLPLRAGKQFSAGRKLGKTHQNILVFAKGDPMKAAKACPEVFEDWSESQEE